MRVLLYPHRGGVGHPSSRLGLATARLIDPFGLVTWVGVSSIRNLVIG